MKSETIGAKIQECRDRCLELLGSKRLNPILDKFVNGRTQSIDEVPGSQDLGWHKRGPNCLWNGWLWRGPWLCAEPRTRVSYSPKHRPKRTNQGGGAVGKQWSPCVSLGKLWRGLPIFQRLTAALDMPQGFSFVAKVASRRVLFPPFMKEGPAWELKALWLYELLLTVCWEWGVRETNVFFGSFLGIMLWRRCSSYVFGRVGYIIGRRVSRK